MTRKSAKGGRQSERYLDSLQVKMINYLQGFCGPGNFLWFLLRRVLQGLRPKVMLSELLRFPILVPNLFFLTFPPHSLLHFSTSNFTTAWSESAVQKGQRQVLSNTKSCSSFYTRLMFCCLLLFNLSTIRASVSFIFFYSDPMRLSGRRDFIKFHNMKN